MGCSDQVSTINQWVLTASNWAPPSFGASPIGGAVAALGSS